MADAVRSAVLNSLPDGLLPEAFAGVNRNIEVLTLNIVKGVHMLFRRVAAFLSCQIEPDHTTLAKVNRQFGHFQRYIHVPHGADDEPGMNPKVLPSTRETLEHS